MRTPSALTIVSVLLALSWIGFLSSAPRAAQQSPPAKKWEYWDVDTNVSAAGRDGWEAYAVVIQTPHAEPKYFLKRPLEK
jgi:hypothetical protein